MNQKMSISKNAIIHIISWCLIGILFLMNLNQPTPEVTISESWGEPPFLFDEEIKTFSQVTDDLQKLGIAIIDTTPYYFSYEIAVKNYSEFRRLAYNSKMVFMSYLKSYGDPYLMGHSGQWGFYCIYNSQRIRWILLLESA